MFRMTYLVVLVSQVVRVDLLVRPDSHIPRCVLLLAMEEWWLALRLLPFQDQQSVRARALCQTLPNKNSVVHR